MVVVLLHGGGHWAQARVPTHASRYSTYGSHTRRRGCGDVGKDMLGVPTTELDTTDYRCIYYAPSSREP